jgi:hypothetical protein
MPEAYNTSIKIRGLLDAMSFIVYIEELKVEKAIEFCQNNLCQYLNEKHKLMIPVIKDG